MILKPAIMHLMHNTITIAMQNNNKYDIQSIWWHGAHASPSLVIIQGLTDLLWLDGDALLRSTAAMLPCSTEY